MQRKLNWKLLLWTLGGLLLAGVAVHFVHAYQVRRNAGSLLANADTARDAGDLNRALTYYHHYLTYEPDDVAAQASFALILDKQAGSVGDHQRVVTKLEEVLRRAPERKDVRFRLIQNLILLYRFRDAISNIQTLLPRWDDKAELEHIQGWCLEAVGDYAKAADALTRSIELNPRRLETYVLLAEVLRNRLDQPGDAEKVMDDLVTANAQTFGAYLSRSKFRLQQNKFAEAEADLKKALELAPKEPAVVLAAADWAQSKGDVDEARNLIKKGWDPRNLAMVKALAGLEMGAGNHAVAIEVLESALKETPRAYELHVLLTDLLIDENKLTDAARIIQELSEANIPSALLDYLRGRIAIGRGQWPDALALLERARTELGINSEWASRVHAMLGLCHQQVGDHEQALAAFRQAVAQEPTWTLARYGLGGALVANGRLEEAFSELKTIQNAADAPAELWTVLARASFYKTLRVPEKQRNWEEVERVLERAIAKTPKSLDLPWLQAEVLAAQKNYANARELLEKARSERPDQVMFWIALSDLAAGQGQWSEAIALLDEAEKKLGDGPELRLARCRTWGRDGSNAARKGLDGLALNLAKFTPQARTRILRELADTWVRLGDAARAEVLWQRITVEQPRDLRSRYALFENALYGNHHEKARTLLADLRKVEGADGNLWRFATIATMVHEARGNAKKLEEARKALADLGRRQKGWPRIPLLKARIEEVEGNLDKAIANYLEALDLGERQPQNVDRLVQLLIYTKRYLDAEQVLVKVEEQMPLPPELLRMGADIALANQNPKEALRRATQIVGPNSRDYRDFLWIGRIFHGAAADQQAEDALRRAVALAPHTPDTWIALAEHLTRIGQRDKAKAVTTEAAEKVGPSLALGTQARCYEAMGLMEEAEALYRQALAKNAADFSLMAQAAEFFRRADQPAKAEPYLFALLRPSANAPADYVLQARRQLALLLAERGSREIPKALALIDGNLKSRTGNSADLRARALVQAGQSTGRRAAIRIFEKTAARQPLSADEQLQFAQLHDADGDLQRSGDQIVALLTAQPENPQFLAFYIRHLVKAEEIEQARRTFQKLERLEPSSPRTLELKELVK